MPLFIVIIVVFILVLTAWIIVHPNPMFEDNWALYSWSGPKVDEFIGNLKLVTFALGETREEITLVPEGAVEPMAFALDEISGSEVRAHTQRNGLKFTLNYDLEPYERVTLTVKKDELVAAEMIFIVVKP
jgi:hypothetical protein